MTRVLVIAYVWPEPASSAAGSRMMQLIKAFQQQSWMVTVACPATYSEHAADLEDLAVQSVTIELNSSSFNDFVAELNPDIVLFDRFMMEEQFSWRVDEACPTALKILDTVDLHFLREARQKADKAKRDLETLDLLQSDLAKRELAAIYRSDLSLIISEFETQLLQKDFGMPAFLLHYLPFMLELSEQVGGLPFKERKHFVSIGNFLHAPNWDAVLYLKESIWPLIRQQLPEAELHVYGAYGGEKVVQLHNEKQGFLIKGRANDALEVVKEARVLLAPLRFGAGLKGKLIDALLTQTPSVTSSIGAEGMHGDLAWAGFVTDDAAEFAEAAVKLYKDETAWQVAQEQASIVLTERFMFEPHAKAFITTIRQIHEKLELHRTHNFTGAMLKHHLHRSTEFMSRWIELKNKGF